MAFIRKLPPFENVVANNTATMPRLPMGLTYHGIILKLGGTFTKAQITAIRMRLDGKQFIDITGAHLDTIDQFDGRTPSATYLTIPFGEANARTIIGEGIGSIETALYDRMELEVDIGAATAPTLNAWAIVGGPKQNRKYARFIRAYLKTTHTPAAAGEFNLPIPLGSLVGAEIKRLHLFHANLTKLQVTRDGLWLLQEGETGLLDFTYGELNRVPQAGYAAWEPAYNDDQSNVVPTYREDGSPAPFEFKATVSAADTLIAYSDLYAPSIAHV